MYNKDHRVMKKIHIEMINHLMLIQGIAFNEKTCMINIY